MRNRIPDELKARAISFWQVATLRDIASGEAHRRAKGLRMRTIDVLNGQTLSSCEYNKWVVFRGVEPYITELGQTMIERYTEHEGRYRENPTSEIAPSIERILQRRKKSIAA